MGAQEGLQDGGFPWGLAEERFRQVEAEKVCSEWGRSQPGRGRIGSEAELGVGVQAL